MKLHRVTLALLAVALLDSCATPSTLLVNQEGKVMRCASHGWGYIGAPMAGSIHDGCVSDFKKLGFVPLPDVVWGVRLADWSSSPARVKLVEGGSSAEASGIKSGYIVRKVDNQPINKGMEIFQLLAQKKPGEVLRAQIERDGTVLDISSTLAPVNGR